MLEALGEGLWTVSAPLRLAGAQMGTRMTVVRLGGGGLALIAPIPIDDALAAELAREGPVAAILAPNAFHHFYLAEAADRYPQAACFLAEGVREKLGQTAPDRAVPLTAEPDPLWRGILEQTVLGGAPRVNEVIFYHPGSKTLVLTDLCFNFDPAPGGWTGLFLRVAGAHGRLAASRLMRSMLSDREQVRKTVRRILDWDFERIIVTHGHNVMEGGREKFRAATADL